jgi:hypothetical protein
MANLLFWEFMYLLGCNQDSVLNRRSIGAIFQHTCMKQHPISPDLLGTVPHLWIFKSSVLVPQKIWFGVPRVLGFPSYKNMTFLIMHTNISTFPHWEIHLTRQLAHWVWRQMCGVTNDKFVSNLQAALSVFPHRSQNFLCSRLIKVL